MWASKIHSAANALIRTSPLCTISQSSKCLHYLPTLSLGRQRTSTNWVRIANELPTSKSYKCSWRSPITLKNSMEAIKIFFLWQNNARKNILESFIILIKVRDRLAQIHRRGKWYPSPHNSFGNNYKLKSYWTQIWDINQSTIEKIC